MKPGKILRVNQLPEDLASQQRYIDRAEEDLLCAIDLYRRGICGAVPYVVVCFLLHQATEKWLKAFLAVAGLEFPPKNKSHELCLGTRRVLRGSTLNITLLYAEGINNFWEVDW